MAKREIPMDTVFGKVKTLRYPLSPIPYFP